MYQQPINARNRMPKWCAAFGSSSLPGSDQTSRAYQRGVQVVRIEIQEEKERIAEVRRQREIGKQKRYGLTLGRETARPRRVSQMHAALCFSPLTVRLGWVRETYLSSSPKFTNGPLNASDWRRRDSGGTRNSVCAGCARRKKKGGWCSSTWSTSRGSERSKLR